MRRLPLTDISAIFSPSAKAELAKASCSTNTATRIYDEMGKFSSQKTKLFQLTINQMYGTPHGCGQAFVVGNNHQ